MGAETFGEFEPPPTLAQELLEQGVRALRQGDTALAEGQALEIAAKKLSRRNPKLSTTLFEIANNRFEQSWFSHNGALVAIGLFEQVTDKPAQPSESPQEQ